VTQDIGCLNESGYVMQRESHCSGLIWYLLISLCGAVLEQPFGTVLLCPVHVVMQPHPAPGSGLLDLLLDNHGLPAHGDESMRTLHVDNYYISRPVTLHNDCAFSC
jgi:hypothetical protein